MKKEFSKHFFSKKNRLFKRIGDYTTSVVKPYIFYNVIARGFRPKQSHGEQVKIECLLRRMFLAMTTKIKLYKFIPFPICTLLLFSILLMSSCKTTKKIAGITRNNIDTKSARTLLALLKTNEFKFDYLSARFSSDVVIDSNDISFNVNMRMRKDSAIWMSISPLLGIEVARIIITKDSLRFINRTNSTYFAGDYNYIGKILHSDLDFEMIQSLLIWNSISFYEEEEKLKSSVDKHKYLLSTVRKRRLRKVMEKNKELKEPVQSIWIEPDIYKVSQIFIDELNTNRTFNAKFEKFERQEDSLYFPYKSDFTIKAEKNISIGINYSKVTINKSQTFPFSVPEGYELIYYKEQ